MWTKILLATDLTEVSRHALTQAVRIARRDRAELHVIHVEELHKGARADDAADDALGILEVPSDLNAVRRSVRSVSAAPAILDYAHEQGIDLIVVGSHGHSRASHWFLGSVAQEVVRGASGPVLVVGRHAGHVPESGSPRVLAAIDFSEASEAALRAAAKIAGETGATLLVMHAIDTTNMPPYFMLDVEAARRDEVEHLLQEVLARSGLPADTQTVICDGRADTRIVETARDHGVGLIVTGATGHGVVERLLVGSVTERVLRSAPCPVLAYRRSGR